MRLQGVQSSKGVAVQIKLATIEEHSHPVSGYVLQVGHQAGWMVSCHLIIDSIIADLKQ